MREKQVFSIIYTHTLAMHSQLFNMNLSVQFSIYVQLYMSDICSTNVMNSIDDSLSIYIHIWYVFV